MVILFSFESGNKIICWKKKQEEKKEEKKPNEEIITMAVAATIIGTVANKNS